MTPEELHACHAWFPIETLTPLPGNPNQGDVALLTESVETFGWLQGIVVHKGVILAGNHRYHVAIETGAAGLPGYDLSAVELTEARRMAMALAHNHTARAGRDDPLALEAAHQLIAERDAALAVLAGRSDVGDLLPMPVFGSADLTATVAPPGGLPASVRFVILTFPAETFASVTARLDELRRPDEPNADLITRLLEEAASHA